MNKIKKFVSNLLKDYFNDQDKAELIKILSTSLEEKIDDLVESGTSRDDAIEQSILEFGSTEDVLAAFKDQEILLKAELKKRRRSQLIFSLFGYLIIVGLSLFLNLTLLDFFGNFYWFAIVAIGLLFWPVVMAYRYYLVKK
jgi:Arc/MetJ-type ribon-helix-helix transcriptional regulator